MELIHVLLIEYCHNLTDAYQPLCTKQQITLCVCAPSNLAEVCPTLPLIAALASMTTATAMAAAPKGLRGLNVMTDAGWRMEDGGENGERIERTVRDWRLTRCVSYIPIPGFHEIWTRLRGFPWEVAPNMLSRDRTFRRGMRRWACPL